MMPVVMMWVGLHTFRDGRFADGRYARMLHCSDFQHCDPTLTVLHFTVGSCCLKGPFFPVFLVVFGPEHLVPQ